MPELVVSDLAKRYGDQQALDHVSFTVADGEFFTLLGPSGCGKSTTLMSVAGLEEPDSGTITAGGTVFFDRDRRRNLPPEDRNLGMVFQSYALWPHMTVAANLDMPLRLRKRPAAERAARIDDVLQRVGLEQYRDRYPHQMSGGQQQRVALARAIVYAPSVLLLDEPLSNLDARLRDRARNWLKDLQRDVGITTLYVTHDQTEALTLSDRLAVMQDGVMLQVGTPEEVYEHPARPEVADFVGRCNFLPGTAGRTDENGVLDVELAGATTVRVRAGERHEPGAPVTVAVRAERLAVVAGGAAGAADGSADGAADGSAAGAGVGVLRAELGKRSYAGSRYEYEATYEGVRLVVDSEQAVDGEHLALRVPEDGGHVFAGTFTGSAAANPAVPA